MTISPIAAVSIEFCPMPSLALMPAQPQPSPEVPDSAMAHAPAAIAEQFPWLRRGRIPLLDGIRAVAVLLVLAAHTSLMPTFPGSSGWVRILQHGAIGVDIFFAISGFLITNLLIREQERTGRICLKSFFVRRTLRLLPAYAVFLVALLVLQLSGYVAIPTLDWLATVTQTSNFLLSPAWEIGHTWSLAIEQHFYLVWPLLFVTLGACGCGKFALGSIAFSFLVRTTVLLYWPDDAWNTYRWTFTRMDTIAIGCVLAIVSRSDRFLTLAGRLCRISWMPGLAIAGLMCSCWMTEFYYPYAIVLAFPVNSLLIATLLWSCLIRADHPAMKVLENRWVRAIGIQSYSLYLWQQLFLSPDGGLLGSLPLGLAAAFFVGWISYRFVELPVINLRRQFTSAQTSGAGIAVVEVPVTFDATRSRIL